ncbi:MAG: hypothetical protein LBH16_00775 [Treponema sp.]|jgi:hypothetical protein|nr:hypothetical protein [Treponema sp.]
MKKKSVLSAAVLLLTFCLAGCAGSAPAQQSVSSTLAGTWVPLEDQEIYDNFIEERLELSDDGTGIFEGYTTLKWKAENSRLVLTFLEMELELEYDYKLSGSTLTLTRENGRSVKYKKE